MARNPYDIKNWEPRTQEGVDARAQYLRLKAQERADNFRGTDEERILFAEALLAQVKRDASPPAPVQQDEQDTMSLFE